MIKLCVDPSVKHLLLSIMWLFAVQDNGYFLKQRAMESKHALDTTGYVKSPRDPCN